jgi:hypothetical protein
MKLPALILALITLILSVSPCCGDDDHCAGNSSIDECEHSDKEREPCDEQGLCSPFYSCGSCTGFALSQAAIHVPFNEMHRNIIPIVYRESLPKEVFFLSFKPPQVI